MTSRRARLRAAADDLSPEPILRRENTPGRSAAQVQTAGQVMVPVEFLAHDPLNPDWRQADSDELRELARTFEQGDLVQPLSVATRSAYMRGFGRWVPPELAPPESAWYVVLDGNRRLAANLRYGGLEEMKCDVIDRLVRAPADAVETKLITAIHHEAFLPMDEARFIRMLVDVHDNQTRVAALLGKTQGWVSQRLSLLKLSPEVAEKVQSRELPVEDARQLGGLPQEDQPAAAERLRQDREQRNRARRLGKRESAGHAGHPGGESPAGPADPESPGYYGVTAGQGPGELPDGRPAVTSPVLEPAVRPASGKAGATPPSDETIRVFRFRGIPELAQQIRASLTAGEVRELVGLLK